MLPDFPRKKFENCVFLLGFKFFDFKKYFLQPEKLNRLKVETNY